MFTATLFLCFAISGSMARAPYQFSDGYLDILGSEPTQDFTCEGLPYGYYADIANDCRVFHICLPIPNNEGEIRETHHYSFFCGNTTVFSQETLTCVHEADALPCSESETLYAITNSEFGRIPEERAERRNSDVSESRQPAVEQESEPLQEDIIGVPLPFSIDNEPESAGRSLDARSNLNLLADTKTDAPTVLEEVVTVTEGPLETTVASVLEDVTTLPEYVVEYEDY